MSNYRIQLYETFDTSSTLLNVIDIQGDELTTNDILRHILDIEVKNKNGKTMSPVERVRPEDNPCVEILDVGYGGGK